MSISAASINEDGTVSTTGGTATGMKVKGQSGNSMAVILNDGAEFINQVEMDFSIKDPKPLAGAPNGYTQARSSVVIREPLALDNGERTVNTVRIEFAVDHETTAAEITQLRVRAAQIIADSDFDDFWNNQALS